MNRYLLVALALVAAACGTPQPSATAAAATQGAPLRPPDVAAGAAAGAAAGSDAATVAGVVAETMNSGGYTYARLSAGGKDTWIAGTEFGLKVGDQLTAAVDMPMENFRSRTLNREFPLIYFVRDVALNGRALPADSSASAVAPQMAGSHGGVDTSAEAVPRLIEPIAPAPGGLKVAEVWARRAALSGKTVMVRGKVVKANYEIMGTNWYHLQDGSGGVAAGTHDLAVTSSARAGVGDVVTVSGALSTGKDFGAGYSYDVIVEKAEIKE